MVRDAGVEDVDIARRRVLGKTEEKERDVLRGVERARMTVRNAMAIAVAIDFVESRWARWSSLEGVAIKRKGNGYAWALNGIKY